MLSVSVCACVWGHTPSQAAYTLPGPERRGSGYDPPTSDPTAPPGERAITTPNLMNQLLLVYYGQARGGCIARPPLYAYHLQGRGGGDWGGWVMWLKNRLNLLSCNQLSITPHHHSTSPPRPSQGINMVGGGGDATSTGRQLCVQQQVHVLPRQHHGDNHEGVNMATVSIPTAKRNNRRNRGKPSYELLHKHCTEKSYT